MLSYFPPSCSVDPGFWEELYNKKVNVYKLDDSEVEIAAGLSTTGEHVLTAGSFGSEMSSLFIPGKLRNFNTIEAFKDLNKKNYLQTKGSELLSDMLPGSSNAELSNCVVHPRLLNQFVLIVFADLKSHKYTFWFGAPTIALEVPTPLSQPPKLLKDSSRDDIHKLSSIIGTDPALLFELLPEGVFGLRRNSSDCIMKYTVAPLASVWKDRYDTDNITIVIIDNNAVEDSDLLKHGWGLRNLIALLELNNNCESTDSFVNVISLRHPIIRKMVGMYPRKYVATTTTLSDSEIIEQDKSIALQFNLRHQMKVSEDRDLLLERVIGWSPNERGKAAPRVANLSSLLDSKHLIQQAMNLNLRLMKWRLWPSLDTDLIANTRCLLLGAGTLGCAVARALIGWGVNNITLVDNGLVSYSNPARQCLFELSDCENKKYKAVAAADALKRILPTMNAQGIVMTIPMPGHPFSSPRKSSADAIGNSISVQFEEEIAIEQLDALIRDHDVVFALTDSREARWLPTVICAARDKLLINSALGFDSYLVMRHGHGPVDADHTISSNQAAGAPNPSADRLGCYFCTDVVAAINSQKDRTLDQQCTVTRPGLSFISAGLAVELMVALLQSPLRQRHPSELVSPNEAESQGLDPIPHQMRGSLRQFNQFCPALPAFAHCTACCPAVINQYRANGVAFVANACNDLSGKYLEDLSGITALTNSIDDDLCDFEEDESDDM